MPIEPPEIIHVTETTVACDGGEGALGHPRVYLHMTEDNRVTCPYCDRLFILDRTQRKAAAGH